MFPLYKSPLSLFEAVLVCGMEETIERIGELFRLAALLCSYKKKSSEFRHLIQTSGRANPPCARHAACRVPGQGRNLVGNCGSTLRPLNGAAVFGWEPSMPTNSNKRARDDARQPQVDERHHGHSVLVIAVLATLFFVFGSALTVVAVAAHSCVIDHSCSQLDGLSHVIVAWTGAVIAGAVGYLFGSSSRHIL